MSRGATIDRRATVGDLGDVGSDAEASTVGPAADIVEYLPRGRSALADQLQRASTSISLNIAEGAGEFSKPEKARFYRMARRSATECAAVLDVAMRLGIVSDERYGAGRALLLRIVAMLVRMAKPNSRSGTGSGTGTALLGKGARR